MLCKVVMCPPAREWHKNQVGFTMVSLLLILLMGSCTNEQEPLEIDSIIATQTLFYPELNEQDWYKLFHQASMGNRHLGVDDSLIYNYLLAEWARIDASDEEPLLEYISTDSSVVRLNLRPYKASGGTPDAVFDAMKKTWESFSPSEDQLVSYLTELQRASRQRYLDLSTEELVQFINQKKEEGFPAVHHSKEYESLYKPAYRVLERRFVP